MLKSVVILLTVIALSGCLDVDPDAAALRFDCLAKQGAFETEVATAEAAGTESTWRMRPGLRKAEVQCRKDREEALVDVLQALTDSLAVTTLRLDLLRLKIESLKEAVAQQPAV